MVRRWEVTVCTSVPPVSTRWKSESPRSPFATRTGTWAHPGDSADLVTFHRPAAKGGHVDTQGHLGAGPGGRLGTGLPAGVFAGLPAGLPAGLGTGPVGTLPGHGPQQRVGEVGLRGLADSGRPGLVEHLVGHAVEHPLHPGAVRPW